MAFGAAGATRPADDFTGSLSLQGYTGLLNTPNALVTREADIDLLYTDHFDAQFSSSYEAIDSYLLSMGVWPRVELGGRLIALHDDQDSAQGGRRDLSGNIKWQLFKHDVWPSLAIGAEDFSGEAPLARARYVVATKQISALRLSLGYGFGPDRMEGTFGGAELRLASWLHALAEYDTVDANYGVRVKNPAWRWPVSVALTAKKAPDSVRSDTYYSFGVTIPLGRAARDVDPMPEPEIASPAAQPAAIALDGLHKVSQETVAPPREMAAPGVRNDGSDASSRTRQTLLDILTDLGFERVRVGTSGDGEVLFVEYENSRYNHNELDALGLVLGVAVANAPAHSTTLTVLSLRYGIPVLEVTTSVDSYRAFLRGPIQEPLVVADSPTDGDSSKFWLQIRAPKASYDYAGIEFHNPPSPWKLRSELFLYPETASFVGTEYGRADASIALRADWYLRLWQGAAFNVMYQEEVYHSRDFAPGEVFEPYRLEDGLRNVLFHQTFKLHPRLMTLTSLGQYEKDYFTVHNDTILDVADTPLRLRARLGYFDSLENEPDRSIAVGSLQYSYAPMNALVEASFGHFWYEDNAFTLEAARYFGDTKITLYYKNNTNESAGLRIALPLTPRRDTGPSVLQVKGASRWTYGLQTSVNTKKGGNPIDTNIAVVPNLYHNLENAYQNQGRLSAPYIKSNALRLRDAYRTWGLERKVAPPPPSGDLTPGL